MTQKGDVKLMRLIKKVIQFFWGLPNLKTTETKKLTETKPKSKVLNRYPQNITPREVTPYEIDSGVNA